MRALAAGKDREYRKYRKLLQEKFVLLKVVRAGADERKFDEPPQVAKKAQARLDELRKDALRRIEDAARLEPDEREKALRRIARRYRKLDDVEQRAEQALEDLEKEQEQAG